MKPWITIFLFMAAITISQLACMDDLNPNSPQPVPNFGSGPTPVPGTDCSMTSVVLQPVTVISGGTTLKSPPPVASTPATVFSGSFSYSPTQGFVLRNLTDWKAFYGSLTAPPPPVDFNSQMILVVAFQGCFDQPSFLSVCEDSSQVMVSIHDYQGGPHCFSIINPPATIAVAVPQSNLPLNWKVSVY
jgi:hypothetical protein